MVAMGAEELAAAFHAPMRSELSNIWNEALQDDDDDEMGHAHMDHTNSTTTSNSMTANANAVSPSSSSSAASNSSSPGVPPPQTQQHQQQQQQQQHQLMTQQSTAALLAATSAMMNPGAAGFFYPMNANLHMNDLSAFLASSAAHHQTPGTRSVASGMIPHSGAAVPTGAQLNQTTPGMPMIPTFLDDLLSSTDDMDFRVRGGAQNSNTTNFMHNSLPPSIQQQLTQSMQRQLAATPMNMGSLADSPFLGLDGASADDANMDGGDQNPGMSGSGATASRLLQLENNYERKKKRAKINRKDLNARFQELMDILNLKEDRKLNRAKILEKTIEYIEKLEDELHAIRSQADQKKAPANGSATANANAVNQIQHQQQPAQMLLQNPSASHAMGGGSGSLMTFDPTTAHAWSAAGATNMPMAQMMWLPCSMVAPPPPNSAMLRGATNRTRTEKRSAVRGSASSKAAKPMVAEPESAAATIPVPDIVAADPTTADGAKRSLKRAREPCNASSEITAVTNSSALALVASTHNSEIANVDSVFVWSAQEIPTLLSFCDAWTLVRLMQTSKELAGVARQNRLWMELCRRRWRLGANQLQLPNAREQWTRWHHDLYLPACGSISAGGIRFASGRANGVHAWGLLARRSNGRTTRTVLLGGRATVMQVVELYVVLQNMSQHKVRLTDQISVTSNDTSSTASTSGGISSFQPFTSGSGAHLTPHMISFNDEICAKKDLDSVVLHHGDMCVLDVFLQCPGLDLEQEFLQRAGWLNVQCTSESAECVGAVENVAVRAHCIDEQQKRLLIDAHYSSLDAKCAGVSGESTHSIRVAHNRIDPKEEPSAQIPPKKKTKKTDPKKKMKVLSIGALAAAAVALMASPLASALSTDTVGLSASERQTWEAFVEYAIEYEKEYRSLDNNHGLVQRRFEAFSDNLDRIKAHNDMYARGEYTFELGVNHLADLTNEEYKQLLGYKRSKKARKAISTFTAPADKASVPDTWDWREHEVVTPVKNQGQCGSCWAFSAVASMESVYAISTGKLESFSEQELVDCVLGGIDTCNHGGEMHDGFEEIITNHGGKIETEADYEYTAVSKGLCKADDSKAIGHFTAYANVTQGDEDALKAAIATKGVQSVAIDASSFTFQLYRHGVYSWPLCASGPDQLDHGVAAAGYGNYKGKDFWLVKNSWGESWGMKGYIMMSRNKKNQCGIATDASYPIMAKEVGRNSEFERA